MTYTLVVEIPLGVMGHHHLGHLPLLYLLYLLLHMLLLHQAHRQARHRARAPPSGFVSQKGVQHSHVLEGL